MRTFAMEDLPTPSRDMKKIFFFFVKIFFFAMEVLKLLRFKTETDLIEPNLN
jgi:hypothetical protein